MLELIIVINALKKEGKIKPNTMCACTYISGFL